MDFSTSSTGDIFINVGDRRAEGGTPWQRRVC